ncbi:unnamed protein product [Chilo suppressalis]|uniref:Methyltransferase domain-containing protein n=1 Tax=Chilo suppressalis TaxID=168631 RepID=A0ABN8B6Q6_CHISP|nr:hypothetical protein evm_013059 [Chilo suppressalis]CAH0405171.1 unnamed protein product [Chilo suppressalis]
MFQSLDSIKKHEVENYIEKSFSVIRTYDWLLDLYVLDFFVDNHWNKLPLSWRESFNDIDPSTLGHILSGKPANIILPLSFLALKRTVDLLSIPRQQKTNMNITNECGYVGNNPKLKKIFLKHVKLKKRHEIGLMANIVKNVSDKTKCVGVLDFGSGLGHLVRLLAYKYNLHTAGIECQFQLTEEARNLDHELEYTIRKHISEENMKKLLKPTHINVTLKNHQQLSLIELPETLSSYGLVGLHPCGDLGPLLLKHFASCDKVKFICLVGCCFMKLTDHGYPLSQYAKSLNSHLSYPSREIACHAIEVYCDRLRKGDYKDLKIHAYRAALERILVDIDPKLKHAPVRSIKHSDTMTFERYCSLAMERLSIPLPTDPDVWSRGQEDVQLWRRVVIVYSLRLALAPLVETVILLDRLLFVLEQGFSCEILPVFDPKISPRNHIMIAKRQ